MSAFDRLRHLVELIEEGKECFKAMPCAKLVVLVKKLDASVMSLNSLDPWSTETTAVRKKTRVGGERGRGSLFVGAFVLLCVTVLGVDKLGKGKLLEDYFSLLKRTSVVNWTARFQSSRLMLF